MGKALARATDRRAAVIQTRVSVKGKKTPGVDFDNLPLDTETHQDTRLGFLMHDVSRLRRAAFDQEMRRIGVTRAQWWVIAHLSRHDGMMQVELATMLDIGKASLGYLIGRLESGKWIERRPHPVDSRAKQVFLTSKSRRLVEHMLKVEYDFNESTLKGLSRQSRTDMLSFISKMKTNLLGMTNPTETPK